jgi:uncharacterized radical SAM protein YgiQ
MFIPTTKEEAEKLGWDRLDVILISGDTYIDSSFNGSAVIGKLLISKGYRVGIISQPEIATDEDIKRLGEPLLFWGVTGGSFDSMVANYTSLKKRRKSDDLTPGLVNNRRPDRAVILYSNLIRRYYKNTAPIVLGGVEASLRRIAHYDYWDNKIRGSILFDAKADILVYGMGEKAVVSIAENLKSGKDCRSIKGICYISKETVNGHIELPDLETVRSDNKSFSDMFKIFYENNDPYSAKGLYQKHGDRFLVQNPPSENFLQSELDQIYELDFERDAHPFYKKQGEIRALDTARFSITTHRGCYGECNFCAITVHQGRRVISRSSDSIIREIKKIVKTKGFKGIISDIGGPTANMFDTACKRNIDRALCKNKRCLYTKTCSDLDLSHQPLIQLLEKASLIEGVRKIFTASGVRYDMVNADKNYGDEYLELLAEKHISGQMKIAPEHSSDEILKLMGKPPVSELVKFRENFEKVKKRLNAKVFLTYYFIAAYPGCSNKDMSALRKFASGVLKHIPEQMQIFTPSPSTYGALTYYTETDPFTGKKIFVEKSIPEKKRQKDIIFNKK